MLVTEYKYRNFIIRHTKDNKGFDIIAVSKELPKNLRKSIRWGLSSLTEAELDYYGRGLGEASKPMKSLSDINQFISGLYSDTVSPTGAKLSENKRYLTLPNGKVIDLKTGRQLQSIEGLELFMGGRI